MFVKYFFFLAFLTLELQTITFGQAIGAERGSPPIKFFTPKEFKSHPQNWAIVQDSNGIMYFGNDLSGVLQYDGVSWRSIRVPSGAVKSLTIDKTGRVFVGSYNDFGYLSHDSNDKSEFVSLNDGSYGELKFIKNIHTTTKGTYFLAPSKLIQMENDSIKTWNPITSFINSFLIEDRIYVAQKGVGVMRLYNGELKLIPGGEKFADDNIISILPFDNNRLIFATTNNLYLYNGKDFSPFYTDADELLFNITHGALLPDNTIAYATVNSGIIIISKKGKIVRIFDRTSGLGSNEVNRLYVDNQNALWAIIHSGIAWIKYPSPVTYFNKENESQADIFDAVRHQKKLYVINSSGVFRLREKKLVKNGKLTDLKFSEFEKVLLEPASARSLLSVGKHLIVGTDKGIITINNNKTELIANYGQAIYCLYRSKIDSMRVFVGTGDGLASIRLSQSKPDTWIDEGVFQGISGLVRSINEDDDGLLWVGSDYNGLIRIDFTNGFSKTPRIETFEGIPELLADDGKNDIQVYSVNNKPLFVTANGIFRFNKATGTFEPENSFGKELTNGTYRVWGCKEDYKGNVYFDVESHKGNNYAVSKKSSNGNYIFTEIPFKTINQIPSDLIFTDYDASVWLGTVEILINYDPAFEENFKADSVSQFSTIIRKVLIHGDSLINGGDGIITTGEKNNEINPREFQYKENSIRFEFAATSFDNSSSNMYKYYLDGFDDSWSSWQYDTHKDYSHLPPGDYIFKVQGQNVYNQISNEANYAFSIISPWYLTYPAYFLYTSFFILCITLVIKYRIHQAQKIEHAKSEQRAQIRKEMAADFHDGAGDKLAQISLFTKFVQSNLKDGSEDTVNALRWTVEAAEALKQETRDFIWILDTKHDLFWDTADRIAAHGKDLFSKAQPKIKFNIYGLNDDLKTITLPLNWQRNLIFIFKEGINNAFKYSKGNEVSIFFSIEHNAINIRLEDNGIGANPNEDFTSKGIKNMYMRAKKLNAELVITSESNKGTIINLKCKLPII